MANHATQEIIEGVLLYSCRPHLIQQIELHLDEVVCRWNTGDGEDTFWG